MTQDLLARRERLLGPNMSTFYETPVHIVRGEGVWLWDAKGRKYLDCYNNVPHVGHCHPRIVDAIARHAARCCNNPDICAPQRPTTKRPHRARYAPARGKRSTYSAPTNGRVWRTGFRTLAISFGSLNNAVARCTDRQYRIVKLPAFQFCACGSVVNKAVLAYGK